MVGLSVDQAFLKEENTQQKGGESRHEHLELEHQGGARILQASIQIKNQVDQPGKAK